MGSSPISGTIINLKTKNNMNNTVIKVLTPEHGAKVIEFFKSKGIDTYDDDTSETLSLGSIYILDLFTDEIVFRYTGRPQFADDVFSEPAFLDRSSAIVMDDRP